jgi:hypothetical protein
MNDPNAIEMRVHGFGAHGDLIVDELLADATTERELDLTQQAWPVETPARSGGCCGAFREDPIWVSGRDADVHDIGSLVDLHNDLFAA